MKKSVLSTASLLVVTFVLQGCQTPSQTQKQYGPGTKHQNVISLGVGNQQIPLPEGVWEVATNDLLANNNNTRILTLNLIQAKNSALSKAINIRTSLDPKSNGYVQYSKCGRKDMHYVKTVSNTAGGNQDCRWVTQFVMNLQDSKYKMANETGDYLKKLGISYPRQTIQSGFHMADNSSFLTMTYYSIPSMDGFVDVGKTSLSDSPWHPNKVSGDTKKKAYIDSIISWTDNWYTKVKAGYAGSLAATQ